MKLDKDLNEQILSEAVKPAEGIWYYVWLKDGWRLEICRGIQHKNPAHITLWSSEIIPKLITSHNLKQKHQNPEIILINLYTSMPRGRVTYYPLDYPPSKDEKPGHFYLYHGNDFPSKLNRKIEERKLINSFGLDNLMCTGKVHFEFSPHETMSPEDVMELSKLIDGIQY